VPSSRVAAALWRRAEQDAGVSARFSPDNSILMAAGQAPFAVRSQQTGSGWAQMKYNLHHIQAVSEGGRVYDLSNILIVTPRYHDMLTYGR